MSGERARTTRCRGSPGCAIAGEKSGNVSDCVRLMIVLNSRERGWLAYLHVVQEAVVLEGRDEDLPVGEHAPLEDSDLVGVVYHPLVVLNEPRDESVALKGVRVPAKGREDRGERGGRCQTEGEGRREARDMAPERGATSARERDSPVGRLVESLKEIVLGVPADILPLGEVQGSRR